MSLALEDLRLNLEHAEHIALLLAQHCPVLFVHECAQGRREGEGGRWGGEGRVR
jgi:hypothetical protein